MILNPNKPAYGDTDREALSGGCLAVPTALRISCERIGEDPANLENAINMHNLGKSLRHADGREAAALLSEAQKLYAAEVKEQRDGLDSLCEEFLGRYMKNGYKIYVKGNGIIEYVSADRGRVSSMQKRTKSLAGLAEKSRRFGDSMTLKKMLENGAQIKMVGMEEFPVYFLHDLYAMRVVVDNQDTLVKVAEDILDEYSLAAKPNVYTGNKFGYGAGANGGAIHIVVFYPMPEKGIMITREIQLRTKDTHDKAEKDGYHREKVEMVLLAPGIKPVKS